MSTSVVLAGLLAAVLAGQERPPEVCGGVMGEGADNQLVWVDGFSLSAASVPLDWPVQLRQATTVVCRRLMLTISPNDRYVLDDLGVPFAISDGERMLWLYRADGVILTHMDDGVLSERERQAIDQMIATLNQIESESP